MQPENQPFKVVELAPTSQNSALAPNKLIVSEDLKAAMPLVRAVLSDLGGDLNSINFQLKLRDSLLEIPEWWQWIKNAPSPQGLTPLLIGAGLGLSNDDMIARRLLVGLACSLQPDSFAPPYKVDNLAVTEVIAKSGSTVESHSQNDLPAPPHCAGFFEEVPPHTCYFSCVRPHPHGGAATTVLSLEAILKKAPQALIDEWENKTYYLFTSKRLGNEIKPFKLLSWVDGLPFLRYRKEYTVDFEKDRSLLLLEELVLNPSNHFIVQLQADETLAHWNGAPHSRMQQNGATPEAIELRRKLIRCRTEPLTGWKEKFR